MSQTLGEKLRQAREERGISLSEVAEQTRISSLYLESIEKDDYKPLPGGIFNKGFVKSYAKFIGFDEEEALSDYARLAAENEIVTEHDQRVYRPEVLTDDRTSSSMVPTILFAGVILALMTGGILFVLNYIQNQDPQTANTNAANPNVNSFSSNTNAPSTAPAPVENAPTMDTVRVEFSASADPVSLLSVSDGKPATAVVATGTSVTFEPKVSLRLSYAKALAQSAKLNINGKSILLPDAPENPRRNVIVLVISKDNLAQIWQDGKISYGVPAVGDSNSNTAANVANVAPVTPAPTPAPSVAPTRPPSTPAPRPQPTVSRTPVPPTNRPAGNTAATPRPSPN